MDGQSRTECIESEESEHPNGGVGRGQDGGGFEGGKDALGFFPNAEGLPFGDRVPWTLSSTGVGSSTAAQARRKWS